MFFHAELFTALLGKQPAPKHPTDFTGNLLAGAKFERRSRQGWNEMPAIVLVVLESLAAMAFLYSKAVIDFALAEFRHWSSSPVRPVQLPVTARLDLGASTQDSPASP